MQRYAASRSLSSTLCFVITFVAAAGLAQAQKQFRWKFAEGDEYSVSVVQDVTQTVDIADQTVEIPANVAMTLAWEVDSVEEDGTAVVLQTVEQVTIKMTIPGVDKEVEYDSSSDDEPTSVIAPIADIIKPMIGVEFSQKMDATGQILEVTVPKEAFKGLESNKMLQQFFSGESFKQMIGKASPVFPAEAIEKGHTWQNKATQSMPTGTMTLDSKYTYEGEEKKEDETLDKFSVTLTMALEADSRTRGPKIEITKQDTKGTMLFDQTEGFLAESTLEQSVSMKVTSGDTILNQTVKNSMTLKVVKE
jgi:hypothetical protein